MIERRLCPRRQAAYNVKLQCDVTGKYIPARTHNISQTGALLEMSQSPVLFPGQHLRVGISPSNLKTLLAADDLLPATVIRSRCENQSQIIAIRFDSPKPLAA